MTMTGGHLTQKPYYSSHANQFKDGVKCGDCGGCQGTHSPPLSLEEVSRTPPRFKRCAGWGASDHCMWRAAPTLRK